MASQTTSDKDLYEALIEALKALPPELFSALPDEAKIHTPDIQDINCPTTPYQRKTAKIETLKLLKTQNLDIYKQYERYIKVLMGESDA